MYVCVAEKCEMMDFYFVFFYSSFYRQFSAVAGNKNEKWWIFMYVCMCKAKSIIDGFFCGFFSHAPFPKRFLSAWLYISGANMVNWVLNELILIKVNSISFCEFFWYWKSSIDHYAFLWAITTWVPFWAIACLKSSLFGRNERLSPGFSSPSVVGSKPNIPRFFGSQSSQNISCIAIIVRK